ncbi:MAG: hypothetical protein WC852_02275 [Candidatus Nanoarchaeia archaeon]|jgi:hypothetical protein
MKSTTLASLVIAGGIAANILALDNTVLDSWLTNHIYCPVRYAAEGFDSNDIERVDVAVYIDKELDEEQKGNCSRACSGVWAEYLHEFGISLQMREAEEITLPEEAYPYYTEALSDDDDMTIVFTGKRCWAKDSESVGHSDPTMNIVYIYSKYYAEEAIENVMIHEIGHLFYAGHSEERNCYMHATASPYLDDIQWCEDERSTIRLFKHKIW